MYRCSAPKSSKKTLFFICALYLTAAILFLVGNMITVYRLIPQFAAVFVFAVAVFLSAKKLLVAYEYALEEKDGECIFTVTEIQGSRVTVVCRFSTACLASVEILEKNKKATHGKNYYAYFLDVKPERSCMLKFIDGEDEVFVRIACDERMTELLKQSAGKETL